VGESSMIIAGEVIIAVGVVFVLFGVIGIVRFKNFYKRILVTAKIDTVGAITIFIGVAVRNGLSFFSLKVLLLMFIMVIINPLATHMIARSAYLSDYKTDDEIVEDNENRDYL
jgi:multicomponent Na+:H+ antiporter subunit G